MSTKTAVSRPSISWVDFSPEDLRRARDLIKGMQDEGVLDELGFGILQSAIADRLYPATTTVMTVSRYLYFVPAIYTLLERQRIPTREIDNEARDLQDQLRRVLDANETQYVIGASAQRDIKRAPSNIYWSSLRRLGIFTQPLSEGTYHARFDRLREAPVLAKDDDGVLHRGEEVRAFWDPSLPAPDFLDRHGHFAPDTAFRLTKPEARDLSRRFRELESDLAPSLLTHLVEIGAPDLPYPWLAPRLPQALGLLLRHAEALSALARGATLQYHALLLNARAIAGMPIPQDLKVGKAFARWWQTGREVLRPWNISEFLQLLPVVDALRYRDAAFVVEWTRACLAAQSPKTFLEDRTAQELIRERERNKRPLKARLRHPKHLAQWKPPKAYPDDDTIAYELSYRHDVGQQFVRDIVAGLRAGSA